MEETRLTHCKILEKTVQELIYVNFRWDNSNVDEEKKLFSKILNLIG